MKMLNFLFFLMLICLSGLSFAEKSLFDCSVIKSKTFAEDGTTVTSFGDLKSELENKKINGDLDSMVTRYPSASDTDRQIFKGQFECKDSQLIIAVLSDDGVSVKITDPLTGYEKNVSNYEAGQALPNLDSSLKLIDGSWVDGRIYNVEIQYSNICYTGNGDIDGLTLFFLGEVDIKPNPETIVPDTGISISFPRLIYNIGESAQADIIITGKTYGANVMASVTGLGITQSIVDVSTGSGVVTVNIPLYAIPNTYVYTAQVNINGFTISNTTFIKVISNAAPVVTDVNRSTNEDTPIEEPIILSATDPDGDTLSFSIDNPFVYTPPQNFTGQDVVTYTVDDGRGGITIGTITVIVNPVNDIPVAYGGYFETDEDQSVTINFPGYDVDGDMLSVVNISTPLYGTLTEFDPVTNTAKYTPANNWNGTDSFTYQLNDGVSDSVEVATVNISVNPVGDKVNLAVAKYLYADGIDKCEVSVIVKDDNGIPQPDTTVTLESTGGTLDDLTVITDADGKASTILTSSTSTGEFVITAAIDDDTAREKIIFFTVGLSATDCIIVPDTANPVILASVIGKIGDKITVNAVTNPSFEIKDSDIGFILSVTNGEGTEIDSRTLSKLTEGIYPVSTTVFAGTPREINKLYNIVILKVTSIDVDSSPYVIIDNDPNTPGVKHAVTSWTATPGSEAVLKANISPDVASIHSVYDKLLTWSGGQKGNSFDKRIVSRNEPSRTEIRVNCGSSSDAVISWVAKINIDIADINDSIEDTDDGIASIYPNTDDDNSSAATGYNGSDLDECPVKCENDLVPVSLTVEPSGIGGKLIFTTTSNKIALYRNHDKSGDDLPVLYWDMSKNLDSISSNDEIPPQQLWIEGREISENPGDEKIRFYLQWGSGNSEVFAEDTVQATVKAREGESEVTICVFNQTKDSAGFDIPGSEVYSPIGGKKYVGLKIKLGPGERLDRSMQTVKLKIQDDYNYQGTPAYKQFTFDLTSGYWYEMENPGTDFERWICAPIAPYHEDGNVNGTTGRIFCKIYEWDTAFTPSLDFTPPMGHNGPHTLEVVEVNGLTGKDFLFQHYNNGWQTAYNYEVPAQKAVVKNLVVTNVSTSNGTEDYFKYDPDPESPYNRPVINFTIEDDGDPHLYDAYILMWPTSITADVFSRLTTSDAVAWDVSYNLNAGPVSKTWDGSILPAQWAGHIADQSEWSTYAFEICVYEYPTSNTLVKDYTDWFNLRWPYCITISNNPINGHDVWKTSSENGIDEIRCHYTLLDSNMKNPESISIIPINDNLCELSSVFNNNVTVNYKNGGTEGMIIATNDEIDGIWRAVFTGIDSCWKGYRRDHNNSRMLAINAVSDKDAIYYIDYIKKISELEKMHFNYYNCIYGEIWKPLDILQLIKKLHNIYIDLPWNFLTGPTINGRLNETNISKVVDIENYFKKCKKISVPKSNGKHILIDAPHFNIALLAMIYDSGGMYNGFDTTLNKYSEKQIDQGTSWGFDLQTSLVDLAVLCKVRKDRNVYMNDDLESYAKRVVGANKIIAELADPYTGVFSKGTCSSEDLFADIDAYNIGMMYHTDFHEDKKLSEILMIYYKNDAKLRCQRFENIFGDTLSNEVNFMVQLWPNNQEHYIINKTLQDKKNYYKNIEITNDMRKAIKDAFLSFVKNN